VPPSTCATWGSVKDSSDVLAGYALLKRPANGLHSRDQAAGCFHDHGSQIKCVRISSDFSRFIPQDIKITYEFDQSQYVRAALLSVLREGLIGAGLTGLMILLFLGDWRSSLIVVITIPFALVTAVVLLRLTGQTNQHHDAGRLALAVGVLVDEGTVLMETPRCICPRERQSASRPCSQPRSCDPRLLAMLSVLAVFLPSFFMTGPAQSLFVPLSLRLGSRWVRRICFQVRWYPVLSNWILKQEENEQAEHPKEERFDRFRKRFQAALERIMKFPKLLLGAYAVLLC